MVAARFMLRHLERTDLAPWPPVPSVTYEAEASGSVPTTRSGLEAQTLIGTPPDCAGTSQSGAGDSQVLNGWSAPAHAKRAEPQIPVL